MVDSDFLSKVQRSFQTVQDEQIAALMEFDAEASLTRDHWERADGGGGDTRILKEGRVIEKGGLNYSAVEGAVTPALAQQLDTTATRFAATGVSSVLHPGNPHVPIIHMNVRYFTLDDGTWWFGGGIDLTPHFVVPAEARAFHSDLKAICDRHAVADYSAFKPWADRYFSIPHRGESRVLGASFSITWGAKGRSAAKRPWHFVWTSPDTMPPYTRSALHHLSRVSSMPMTCTGKVCAGDDTWSSIWSTTGAPVSVWFLGDAPKAF